MAAVHTMSEPPTKINEPFALSSDDEDFSLMHKEWSKIDEGLKNAGIRDALESSQDHVLQEGFNAAFRKTLQMAMSAGKLQGSISAMLSYQALAVDSEDGKHSESVLSESTQTQLQELLAENTRLLSSIPQIVENADHKAGGYGRSEITQTGHKNSGASDTDSVSPCLEVYNGPRDGAGQGNQTGASSQGCEQVCSNRSHFWSQLESFKVQARPLGIFTDTD
ncbi:hypothetical protein EGW08_000436 [Elysia chlorotica]|uniref:Essential protein Yae1 N-terminal domain-containing protein n=1 Tax=Elysia chlorotica TaxID=188477 RepID=A0A433UDG6_ELYCH|nr:hypothetical protein EGW08_000436 [Elysia chlorotica]